MGIQLHRENRALFREAIRFTAAETGFVPRLIEKDYFCSVLLHELAALDSPLTFKGGTLLAKVREVAIRDFFDIDHAVRNAALNAQDAALLDLLTRIGRGGDGTGRRVTAAADAVGRSAGSTAAAGVAFAGF